MPIFDDTHGFPIPSWTSDDVTVLEAIDHRYSQGICYLLSFLIANNGFVDDDTLDLILIFNSVVNLSDQEYSFEETEKLVALASEFCLIDCVYENQVLTLVELRDNAVLYLAINEEHNLALEAGVCLGRKSHSILSNIACRPSLSLFGEWEELAVLILSSMLTRKRTSASIGFLMKHTKKDGLETTSDMEFVDCLRKLCEVGLFSMVVDSDEVAKISIQAQPAGLFLLFSNNTDLAKRLASLET